MQAFKSQLFCIVAPSDVSKSAFITTSRMAFFLVEDTGVLVGSTVVFSERECSDCFFLPFFFHEDPLPPRPNFHLDHRFSPLSPSLYHVRAIWQVNLVKDDTEQLLTTADSSNIPPTHSGGTKKNDPNQQVDHYLSGNAAEVVRKPQSASRSGNVVF